MRFFLVFLSFAVVFAFFMFPVTDFDIWFHLADGKYMVENLKLPAQDVYSYTAFGKPYILNSWGFDPLVYLAYKFLRGLSGLDFAKAVMAFLIFVIIIIYLEKKKLLNPVSLLFVVLGLFSIREHFSLRPQILSYLIFVVFLIILSKYRESKKYKYVFWLALLQFVWVNSHSSFIYGIVFSGVLLVSDFILERKIDKKNVVLFGSIFIASLLHIFYGYRFLFITIEGYLLATNRYPIREFYPPTLESFFSLRGLILLNIFLVIYFSFKKKKIDILFSLLLITGLALKSERFMADLVLFLLITAPAFFDESWKSIKKLLSRYKLAIKNPKSLQNYFNIVFFIAMLAVLLVSKNSDLNINLGLQKFTYPVAGVDFLKKEGVLEKTGGNLYNTYNFGGYLIWNAPEYKVFIDGRMQPYNYGIFENYWANFEGDQTWQDSVKKYNITAALMTLPHTDGKTVYNDSTKMFPKDEWALVYYDDVAMLYVKRLDEIGDLIEKYEYKIINPQAMDFSYFQTEIQNEEDFGKALEEIKKGLELNPESYRLHFTASYLFNIAGDQTMMKKELEKTLEINPHFKAAQQILDIVPAS